MLRFEIYRGRKFGRQQWRFRIRSASNYRVLATAGEAYTNLEDVRATVALLTASMPEGSYVVVHVKP
jgi:uncharacterized protein YegP (UPF0339 family)